jgi:hypothetical protein
MDFLRPVGLEDLPEQQTKTVHLMARHPEFALKLGIDACCTCGTPFTPSSTIVDCKQCQRVSYCSEACREQDSSGAMDNEGAAEDEQEETAMGHSSVICTLLKLCNNDECVNQETKDDEKTLSALERDPQAKEAAVDRVRSEFESYPATLSNVILQGPLYEKALQGAGKNLVIHIIGASHDGELWDSPCVKNDDVFSAYADALAELSETRRLDSIELHFMGPECPPKNRRESRTMKGMENGIVVGELVAQTHHGEYTTDLLQQEEINKADIVVFHNPGFTCPDYDWTMTLVSIPKGTPFLVTTNTELEGIADCQFLLENDLIQSIPPMLADIFGEEAPPVTTMDDELEGIPAGPFFNENPFCGNRVRQSGTMANDLFVKNRWMLGGILEKKSAQPSNKRRVTDSSVSNSKAGNPALI